MTRNFEYTFTILEKKDGTDGKFEHNRIRKEITLKKKVTDRMEERDAHKPGYAAHYFNEVLRTKYGYKKSVVTAARIKEV